MAAPSVDEHKIKNIYILNIPWFRSHQIVVTHALTDICVLIFGQWVFVRFSPPP